ncbi:MAG: alpha/beta fold hydrolase [Congregibacter sp.]
MNNIIVKSHFALCIMLLLFAAAAGSAEKSAPLTSAMPVCTANSAGTVRYDELLAKYADRDSRFAILEGLDGIRVHYKDEGTGPAVLLVHSSSGDLKDWDIWTQVLRQDYRVVRLELPAFGLTGPVPSGNYSVERYMSMIDALMDDRGIERFAIVGASYGGLVAFRYAATRIDRVSALILANSAGIEYGGRRGTTERSRDRSGVFKPQLRTLEQTNKMLSMMINVPEMLTAELVQRKTDYANLIGRDCESFVATRLYERGNPQRVLSHVRAPSLVLWGGDSRALSPETAQAFVDGLKNASSTKKIIYQGGGHFLHIERPEESVRDAKKFLDSL